MPSEEYIRRKKAYIKRYQQETYSTVSFKLRNERDKEILEFLNALPSKSDFLKDLIRQYMSTLK